MRPKNSRSGVMDMSFANQALSVEHLLKNADRLEKQVHTIREALDKEIARLKLDSIGVTVDELSKEQKR